MKALIVLFICLLSSFEALAQVKHIVFDIDGFLVQGLPAKNLAKLKDQNQIITQDEAGQKKYYYVAPFATQVITALQAQPQIIVHFNSTKDSTWINALLNKIYVNRDKGITLGSYIEGNAASKFLSASDLVNGKVDLRKISSDLKNVIFVTSKIDQLVAGQEDQQFYTGKPFYVFEDFASSEAEKNYILGKYPTADISTFPATEQEWKIERMRFLRLNAAVLRSIKQKTGFKVTLEKVWIEDPESLITLGQNVLSSTWSEIGMRWTVQNKEVVGCEEFNNLSGQYIRPLSLDDCLKNLPSRHEFILNKTQDKVLSCGIFSTKDKVLIRKVDISECIDKIRLVPHWTTRERKDCALIYNEKILVTTTDPKKCSNTHFLKNPFTDEFEIVEEFTDFETASIEEIFNRTRPRDNDPLQLWFPYQNRPEIGFTLQSCRNATDGNHTTKVDSNGNLLDKCKPDTLYSWGPQGKLNNLISWMGDGPWQPSMRPLFTLRSPVASFGYGDVPVRIKVKAGINWMKTSEAHGVCGTQAKIITHTVFYRVFSMAGSTYLEYIICSPNIIESWSYGHKEHYDEVVKEYVWIKNPSHTMADYELYGSSFAHLTQSIDGFNFQPSTLYSYLAKMISKIENKDSKIFWNPSVPAEERTRINHFKTKVPIYFNDK